MPLYEYRCTACGHVFEKIQSFSAPETMSCPKCGGTAERLLSAPAIQFKGSGFYLTDYGKAGGGAGRESGKTEGSSGGNSGAAESKPAASTPASPAAPAASPSASSGSASTSSGSASSGSAPAKN